MYSFLFFATIISFKLKKVPSTITIQAQLSVIYVSIFQDLLVKFCCKIKQLALPSPVLLFIPSCWNHKKDQKFHFFLPYGLPSWLSTLLWHCDLRKISLFSLKYPSKEVFEKQFIWNFRKIPNKLSPQEFDKVQCCAMNTCFCVRYNYHLACGINSKCTEEQCRKLITTLELRSWHCCSISI